MGRKEAISTMTKKVGMIKFEDKAAISSFYGENTFNTAAMKAKLSKDILKQLQACKDGEQEFTLEIANQVAHAMKEWAMEKGATHYAHWFQPLTGSTAEKHDSFISFDKNGVIERFSGKELVSQEPDASSFPNGGLRVTFEARGYTAWDPTSPAFIMESDLGNTLCIPCAFISYHGEALDKKAPLLRSMESLRKSTRNFLEVFDIKAKKISASVGAEQEYFLVDRDLALLRPDLLITGRTLLGAKPPKGQELDDQYFGSIKSRVLAYMHDVEQALYKLGIPVKTRHNEVAPHQYELAPIFEDANVASDHNQLIMEIMEKTSIKHNFHLSLHEKPFARINGSGKHLNWSLVADGVNLLDPGDNPHDNFQFLTVLVAVVRSVYKHYDLLRASVASAGNDHRLGGNEAPPAIMSVFLGEQLSDILNTIEKGKTPKKIVQNLLEVGIKALPQIPKDNTDRNRTSPFAFTGNKFEFRAVGSEQSLGIPTTVINTIVAESLDYLKEKIQKEKDKGKELFEAVISVCKKVIKEVKPILFEGDNYSAAWREEAAKRGLKNMVSTPQALAAFADKMNQKLFDDYSVFSHRELEARYFIELEKYAINLNIEAELTLEMAKTMIMPAVLKYQGNLSSQLTSLGSVFKNTQSVLSGPMSVLVDYSEKVNVFCSKVKDLEDAIGKVRVIEDEAEQALAYRQVVAEAMNSLRDSVDALEQVTADDLWPLPKYYELLFYS